MNMQELLREARRLLEAGEDPEQYKKRTGRCPKGYHVDKEGKCTSIRDTLNAVVKHAEGQGHSVMGVGPAGTPSASKTHGDLATKPIVRSHDDSTATVSKRKDGWRVTVVPPTGYFPGGKKAIKHIDFPEDTPPEELARAAIHTPVKIPKGTIIRYGPGGQEIVKHYPGS